MASNCSASGFSLGCRLVDEFRAAGEDQSARIVSKIRNHKRNACALALGSPSFQLAATITKFKKSESIGQYGKFNHSRIKNMIHIIRYSFIRSDPGTDRPTDLSSKEVIHFHAFAYTFMQSRTHSRRRQMYEGFFPFVEATSRFLGSYEKALASFSSFWNVIRLPVTRSVGLKEQGGPGVSETRGGARGVIDRRHEAPPRVT